MNRQERLAISLGGSLINPEAGKINKEYINDFADLLTELIKSGLNPIIIGSGGGEEARQRIRKAREVLKIESSKELDQIAIKVTHIHARYLVWVLKSKGLKAQYLPTPEIPREKAEIFITGGDKPGHTTDFVTVKIAVDQEIDTIFNLTDGPIYQRNVYGQPDFEKPIPEMTWKEYQRMFPFEHEPGINLPVDPVAAQLAKEHHKTVVNLDGSNLNNVRKYLEGEEFDGTIIRPDEKV